MRSLTSKLRQYIVVDYTRSCGNVERGLCIRLRADNVIEAVMLLREQVVEWAKVGAYQYADMGRSRCILEEQQDGTYRPCGVLSDFEEADEIL